MLAKIKNFIKSEEKDIIIVVVIITVALISFGLGRLSKIEEKKTPIIVENISASVKTSADKTTISSQEGIVVASKNSTKYHYPWCSGAQNIKEENKIWFNSTEEARQAGYTPASNCKGLK